MLITDCRLRWVQAELAKVGKGVGPWHKQMCTAASKMACLEDGASASSGMIVVSSHSMMSLAATRPAV